MQTLVFYSPKTGYVILGEKEYRKAFVFRYSALIKLRDSVEFGRLYSARLKRLQTLLEKETAYTQEETKTRESLSSEFFENIPDSITLYRTTIKEYILTSNTLKYPISMIKKEESLIKLITGGWMKKSYKKDRLINAVLLKASHLDDAKFQIIEDTKVDTINIEKVRSTIYNIVMWRRHTLEDAVEKSMLPESGILFGGAVITL